MRFFRCASWNIEKADWTPSATLVACEKIEQIQLYARGNGTWVAIAHLSSQWWLRDGPDGHLEQTTIELLSGAPDEKTLLDEIECIGHVKVPSTKPVPF